MSRASIAAWVGMDVAKEPGIVAVFYTLFLTYGYKFILLRQHEYNAMQSGAALCERKQNSAWRYKFWCLFWCLLELEFGAFWGIAVHFVACLHLLI